MSATAIKLIKLLLVVVICFASSGKALCAPLPDASSKSTTHMDFPARQTLGKIYILPRDWNPMTTPVQARFYCEARGRIQVPPGAAFAFEPNALLSDQPQYLSHFPPGTLRSLAAGCVDVNEPLMQEIGKHPALQRLDLCETDIDDAMLAHLKDLKEVRFLSLNKTLVKGPGLHSLTAMKNVLFINLSGDALQSGATRLLQKFPVLDNIGLTRTLLTDKELVDIANIKTLTTLSLSFNDGITDVGMKSVNQLPRLRVLDVDETSVTMAGLTLLKGHALQLLCLPARYNNKADLAKLRQAFPKTELSFSARKNIEPVEFFDPNNRLHR
ncbi:MAG: hypothetical protein JST01_17290 [Cyanobacteria bacterium SZAS TMP-1]|nr:hypothetical protein [Cyanobacteria bacterium SZAS TMP-1]